MTTVKFRFFFFARYTHPIALSVPSMISDWKSELNICIDLNDQNATECLSAFISGGRQEILAWGSDSGSTMRSLLDIASR